MAEKPTATYTPPHDTSTPTQVQTRALIADGATFARRLAVDDASRARLPKVEMVALAGLTLTGGDPHAPEHQTIQAGETFEISEYDVLRFAGRARRKLLDPSTL